MSIRMTIVTSMLPASTPSSSSLSSFSFSYRPNLGTPLHTRRGPIKSPTEGPSGDVRMRRRLSKAP
eukprot:1463036-Pyramimonas_sp.AAC.1